jgi:hypothetical protein
MAGIIRTFLKMKMKLFLLISFPFLIVECCSCSLLHKEQGLQNGIGISVLFDSVSKYPYVVEIISGSPAAMAGLRSGDYLIKIDSLYLHDVSAEKTIKRLKGKAGKSLYLQTRRGNKILYYTISRAQYTIPKSETDLCFELQNQINKLPDYAKNQELVPTLPGFESAGRGVFGIRNVYFECKDTVLGRRKLQHLVSTIAECLTYTIADSVSTQHTYPDSQTEKVNYIIEKTKKEYSQGKNILIQAEYKKGIPLVSLNIGFTLHY